MCIVSEGKSPSETIFTNSAEKSASNLPDCGPKSAPNAPRSVLRLFGYLRGVFRRGLRWWRFDFDLIARTTGMARRTVEWALAWIRRHWTARFAFRTLRVGSVYAVEVSDRNFVPPPTPPLGVGLRPKVKMQTPRSGISPKGRAPGKLARLAWFIARNELAALHWDNCKVTFGFGHAWRFALAALRRGFDRSRIRSAYESALRQRHGDATDYGLSHGCPTSVRWAPSSTVSLAASKLADGRTDCERVAEQIAALAPAKEAARRLRAESRAALASPESVSVWQALGPILA